MTRRSRRTEDKAGGSRHPRAAGFSLIELLIVVVILAVFGGLAVGRYGNSVVHHELTAACRRVQADLELCRQQAIASGTSKTVQFTPGTGRYSLPGLPDINRPGQSYAVDLGATPYQVTISSVNLDGNGATSITFDAFGKPVYTQALAASTTPMIVLIAGSRTSTVAVDPPSGRAYLR